MLGIEPETPCVCLFNPHNDLEVCGTHFGDIWPCFFFFFLERERKAVGEREEKKEREGNIDLLFPFFCTHG